MNNEAIDAMAEGIKTLAEVMGSRARFTVEFTPDIGAPKDDQIAALRLQIRTMKMELTGTQEALAKERQQSDDLETQLAAHKIELAGADARIGEMQHEIEEERKLAKQVQEAQVKDLLERARSFESIANGYGNKIGKIAQALSRQRHPQSDVLHATVAEISAILNGS